MSVVEPGDLAKHRRRIRELAKYYCVTSPSNVRDFSSAASANDQIDETDYAPQPIRLASDEQLTALAQLAAIRSDCRHAFISLIDDQYQHIIAEASRSISPFDDQRHDPGDGLILGVQSIPLQLTASSLILAAFSSTTTLAFDMPENKGDRNYIAITDLSSELKTRNLPILKALPTLRFYLEVPLRSSSGHLLGSACVVDDRVRSPRYADICVLQDIAKLILKHLDRARLKEDYRRAERLLEGLSHFNHGMGSISQWSRETEGQEEIPTVHSAGLPLSNLTISSRHPAVGQTQLNAHSTRASSPTSSVPNEEIHEGLLAVATAQQPSTAPTTISDGLEKSTASSSGAFEASGFAPEIKNDDIDDLQEAPSSSAGVRHVFARASNLIREGMDLDASCFLEVPHNERYKRLPRPAKSKRPSVETGQRSEPESQTDSSSEQTEREGKSSSGDDLTPKDLVFCHRLGFSSAAKSSLASSKISSKHFTIPATLLIALVEKYPDGHIFHFDQQGGSSSSEESQATDESPRKPRQNRKLPSQMSEMFPDARSMLFLPVYDNDRQQVYAGFLCWTLSPTRALQSYELSYVSGFVHSVMFEVMRLEAVATDAAKSDFISSISHELRSPLHGILAANQLLTETTHVQQQQLEFTEMIGSCARSLLDILNQLLHHAKINHFTEQRKGKKRPKLRSRTDPESESFSLVSETNLLTLIEETAAGVAASTNQMLVPRNPAITGVTPLGDASQSQGISEKPSAPVVLRIAPRDSWYFNTEAGSWRRIVMNLLGNALKYTHQGHITLSLTFRMPDMPNTGTDCVAELKITDTGQGISEKYLHHRLYTPFAQENNLSIGTGLGLSLVKQMVDSLDGDVEIQSEVGVGTEVTVRIPLRSSANQKPFSMSLNNGGPALSSQTQGKSFKCWGFDDQVAIRDKTATGIPSPFTKALMVTEQSISAILSDWFGMQPVSKSEADIDIVEEGFLALNLEHFDRSTNDLIVVSFVGRSKTMPSIHKANLQHLLSPFGPTRMANALRSLFRLRTAIANEDKGTDRQIFGHRPRPAAAQDASTTRPPLISSDHDAANIPSLLSYPPTSPPSIAKPSSTPANTQAILLVDDNEINLRILVATVTRFKNESIDYLTAVNGRDALDKYIAAIDAGIRVSLCFMDISMPVMDGFEATRKIRSFETVRKLKRAERCKIIALTSLGSEEAQYEIEDCGFDVYLRKPANLKTVRDLLVAACLDK